jgi:hypothetical protein
MLIPLVVIGCQHVPKYEYTPSVQQVSPAGADKNLGVETFVTLDELTGGTEGKKGHIQFRLRVENRGSSSVKLLPDRIDLISDDLNEFGTPEVKPSDSGSLTVKPSGSLLVTVTFTLPDATEEPAEQYRQFTLMWSLKVEDRTYSNSTTFKRQRLYSERRYRDPYWYHHRYYYDDYPYYRHPYHSRFRFHMGHSYHW